MVARLSLLLLAAGLASLENSARAGWWRGKDCEQDAHYIGRHHDLEFNNRFLQRPYPPYHGWNRPFYGWSSNYRPYYFTPQSYANTPWNYGPCHQETVYTNAAPTPGLNAYGVPVQGTAASGVKPAATTPTPAIVPTPANPNPNPTGDPTLIPQAPIPQTPIPQTPVPPPPGVTPTPATPQPPQPGLGQ